jgi:hypothetical protein
MGIVELCKLEFLFYPLRTFILFSALEGYVTL